MNLKIFVTVGSSFLFVIMEFERTIRIGFEVLAKLCIMARVINCFGACEVGQKEKMYFVE